MEDELTQLNRRLTQLAATDGLTGLTNRRTFDGFLLRQYECCDEISVLLLDIDSFKGYNDTYGHQAGDRCLQAVAKVIGDATANTSGLSARYGGEEFAVVLPDTAEDAALKVAEAIRLTVRALGIPTLHQQPRIHHDQRRRRLPHPLDARRGRIGGRSRHRALRGQASRPEPHRRVFFTRPAICRDRIHSARWRDSRRANRRVTCNPAERRLLSIIWLAGEPAHIHAKPSALSVARAVNAWRSQMTVIARALSRALITFNDVAILQAIRAFLRSLPLRCPADADLRRRSQPGLLLAVAIFRNPICAPGRHERSSDST